MREEEARGGDVAAEGAAGEQQKELEALSCFGSEWEELMGWKSRVLARPCGCRSRYTQQVGLGLGVLLFVVQKQQGRDDVESRELLSR